MSMRRCEIVQHLRDLAEEQSIDADSNKRSIKYFAYILHDKDVYTEEDEKANPEHKAGTLKEPHWHILLVFFDGQQQQIKYIARWFEQPPNTVEKVKSPRVEDAFAYLIHQNSPSKHQYDANEVKANFDYETFIAQNAMFLDRKDELIAQIASGKITRSNMTSHITSHEYTQYKRAIEDAFDYYDRANFTLDRNLDVIFVDGESGLGKTGIGKIFATQRGYSCFISSVGSDMFDGYANEEVVVFDDIRDDCGLTFAQFLKTIDNHTNSRGKSRFRNKNLTFCKTMFITTTLSMHEFLHRLDPWEKENWKQFRRRCRLYITVTENYMTVREYDFQTDSYVNETYLVNPMQGLIEETKTKPKMTPQELSNYLSVPLLPENLNPKKKEQKKKKADFNKPTAFTVTIPESNDITPPPF